MRASGDGGRERSPLSSATTRGQAAGRLAGVAALALAVTTIWLPWLAPGLHSAPQMMN